MIFSSDGFHFHSEMGIRSSNENENGDRARGLLNALSLKGLVLFPATFRYKGIGAEEVRELH